MALGTLTDGRAASVARASAPLRVIVIGLRGVVEVEGGIETHARSLYPLLAKLGCTIEIVQRSPYYRRTARRRHWHGMRLTYLWSPTVPGLETAVHTLFAVLYAAFKRPDILHVHAVGPGLLIPLARLLGLRVVMTHHAADYEREKWGALAKAILRAGEYIGARFANRLIAVSSVIQSSVGRRCGVSATFIPNGAPHVTPAESVGALERFGLSSCRYVLCVARLEPTKRQLDLIDAFRSARMPGWQLALVGRIVPGDAFCEALLQRARQDARIALTDYQAGTSLRELYTHAGLFVLPSSMEGHPIALLEALSYRLPVLVSANTANLAVPLPRDRYFPVGDTARLAALLSTAAARVADEDTDWQEVRDMVRRAYSWQRAARLTRAVYDGAVRSKEAGSGRG